MASTSISDWPEELLSDVFNTLVLDADALTFRSLSRDIAQKTYFSFKKRFFLTRSAKYSRHGLWTLLEIANDDGLGPEIEHLQVTMDGWNHDRLHAKLWDLTKRSQDDGIYRHRSMFHPMRWERNRRRRQGTTDDTALQQEEEGEIARRIEAFDEDFAERLHLVELDAGQALLTSALTRLPNVRSLKARASYTRHCWDAGGALDGAPCGNPSTLVHSWQALGNHVGGLQRLQLLERHCVLTEVMRSLSSIDPLSHLTSLDIEVSSFELRHEPANLPGYLPAQLKSLECTFSGPLNDLRSTDHLVYGPREERTNYLMNGAKDWIVKWANQCRDLRRMVLRCYNYEMACTVSGFANAVKLPKLEHFGLSGNNLDFRPVNHYNSLTTFLSAHGRTLRSVDLGDVFLGSDGLLGHDHHYCKDLLKLLASLGALEELTFKRWEEKVVWPGDRRLARFGQGSPTDEDFKNEWRQGWRFTGTVEETCEKLLELSERDAFSGTQTS